MAIRTIRKEGDPILRKEAKPVKEINDRIKTLLDDMVETMYDDNGVGLAGPQVGILRRVITLDVGNGPIKMVNPRIIESSDETQLDIEGCLSVPNFNGTVERPKDLIVEFEDENAETKRLKGDGLFARCVCHEIDHLDGILFRDRVEKVIDLANLTPEMEAYLIENNLMDDPSETEEIDEEATEL